MTVKLGADEDLVAIVASGPYMTNNSVQSDSLELLIDMVKAKNAHVLILVKRIIIYFLAMSTAVKIVILYLAWSICGFK